MPSSSLKAARLRPVQAEDISIPKHSSTNSSITVRHYRRSTFSGALLVSKCTARLVPGEGNTPKKPVQDYKYADF